jgi:hypothetical protein
MIRGTWAMSIPLIFKHGAVGALATMLAFMPVSESFAAQTKSPVIAPTQAAITQPVQPASVMPPKTPQVKIPVSDARGIQEEGVRLSAAMTSKAAQVIVFYGDIPGDKKAVETFKVMTQAAKEALTESKIALRGIILTDAANVPARDGGRTTRTMIQFFAHGMPTTLILDPDAKVGPQVKSILKEDYTKVIRPIRQKSGLPAAK